MQPTNPPKLLSSGNPQIAKGDGAAPVLAYLDAMPGWKQAVGQHLHKLVLQVYPDARLAVRWNTPLYGKADGWFFAFYCYTKYVQLTFFRGVDLTPPPPGASKVDGVRYLNLHESDAPDDAQLRAWIAEAITLPGVKL